MAEGVCVFCEYNLLPRQHIRMLLITLCSGVLLLPGWGEGGCIGLRLHSLCRGVAPPWVGGGGLYWSQATLSVQGCCSSLGGGRGVVLVSDYTLCTGVLLLPGWGEGGCIGLRLHSLCRGVAPPWVGGGGLYWSQTTLSVQGCCSTLGGGRGVVLVSDYTLCAGVLLLPGWGEGGCIGLRLHSLCRGVAPPWVGGGGLYWSQTTLSVQGCCSSLGGGRGVVLVSDYTLCTGVLLLPGWGEGGCIGLRLHSLCRGVAPPWVGGGVLYWSQATLSVQGCCSSLGGGRGVVLVSDYTLCAGVLLLPGWGEGGCIGLRLL